MRLGLLVDMVELCSELGSECSSERCSYGFAGFLLILCVLAA